MHYMSRKVHIDIVSCSYTSNKFIVVVQSFCMLIFDIVFDFVQLITFFNLGDDILCDDRVSSQSIFMSAFPLVLKLVKWSKA